ncbi:MAG: serine hydrolase domain-containing protein [Pseudomonadales bacterium]
MNRLLCPLLALALLIASGTAAAEGEAIRRAFFEPEGRAQKYQSADQIFPTRTVHAGERVMELPRLSLPEGFDIRYRFEGAEYGIGDFNRRTQGNALLILKGGRIVHESYHNAAGPATRFMSFSTGKSFTSTLVGIALEQGLIGSLDDALTQYLPALEGSAYEGVSIRDALQMVSGVAWDEEAYDWSDVSKPLVRHWLGAYVEQRYRLVEGANGLPRARAPGEKFNYSTMETSILGWLVEAVSRQRLARFMEEHLWRPLGMEFDAAWILDGPEGIGREMAGGGLLATLRDFGRFGLMMANDGHANGTRIVSADWVRAATRPDRPAIEYGNLYPDYPLGYGYQWWLFDDGRYEAQGVYGQLIYVAPEEDVVIVKLSYWPEAWVDAHELESYAFFQAAIEALR